MKKFYAGISFSGEPPKKQFFGGEERIKTLLEFRTQSERDQYVRRDEEAGKVSMRRAAAEKGAALYKVTKILNVGELEIEGDYIFLNDGFGVCKVYKKDVFE